jgi:putative transposase
MRVSAAQIAQALGATVQWVRRRAVREAWPHEVIPGRGGARPMYLVAELPEDVRAAVLGLPGTAAPAEAACAAELLPAEPQPLPAPQRERALRRADLVRIWREHMAAAPWGQREQAALQVLEDYHQGRWPELLRVLGPVTRHQLERWARRYDGRDPLTLADRRGAYRRGTTSLSPQAQEVLLRLVLHPNRVRIETCIRMARAQLARMGINPPSRSACRRFLERFWEQRRDVWAFLRDGAKAWNDQVAMYISRDLARIDVGDIVVADGHRLGFQVLHPDTGRPCRMMLVCWMDMASMMPLGWEIAPEENARVIASALRRAILRLGKVPRVAYVDNGRAFRGTYLHGQADQCGVSGLWERLGIQTIFAWPYHGQSKTIERFFGYLRELEELLPCHTGPDAAHKPAYQLRGERVHRELAQAQGMRPLSLQEAHHAVAAWFDWYASQPHERGALEGRSPAEVFAAGRGAGVDAEVVAALRECMLEARVRKCRRCEVMLPGGIIGRRTPITYFSLALYGREHDVVVRYDPQDLSSVEVYDMDGAHICTAERKAALHPAARILGTDADRAALSSMLDLRRQAERLAGSTARELLQSEILPAYADAVRPAVGALPAPSAAMGPGGADDELTLAEALEPLGEPLPEPDPELEAAIQAAQERVGQPGPSSMEEQMYLEARSADPEATDRYVALLQAEVRGEPLTAEDLAFMRFFELRPQYAAMAPYLEEIRTDAAIAAIQGGRNHDEVEAEVYPDRQCAAL